MGGIQSTEISRIASNTVVLDPDTTIQSHDSYIAMRELKGVGNFIDRCTFVTTYYKESNINTSTGKRIFISVEDKIASYTG